MRSRRLISRHCKSHCSIRRRWGGGFDSLRLRITEEGSLVLDQSFANAALAQAFFIDHVLTLGAIAAGVTGTLDLTINLDLTLSHPGDGFSATVFVGNSVIPEPRVIALILIGLIGLAVCRRIECRGRRMPGV